MENSNTPKQQSEEVELSQFLVTIGRGFQKLKQEFFNLIKSIVRALLFILLFIKKNIVYLCIAGVVSGAIGATTALLSDRTYESTMIVKPNYSSVAPMYHNITYLNELIKERDAKKLQEILGMNNEDVSVIKSIEVEPFITPRETFKLIRKYQSLIDSNLVRTQELTLEDFEEWVKEEDYELHEIKLISTKDTDFSKYSSSIIRPIKSNTYYEQLREAKQKADLAQKAVLERTMQKLDTLGGIYNQVLLEKSKQTNTGDNIYLGSDNTQEQSEEWIYDKYIRTSDRLESLVRRMSYEKEVVQIVSDFPTFGNKVGRLEIAIFNTLIIFGLLVLVLLLIKLYYVVAQFEQGQLKL